MKAPVFVSFALDAVPISETGNEVWVKVLPIGVPEMNDPERKLKVAPEDVQAVMASLEKRNAKTQIPILFQHGKGPRGGRAGGWFIRFEVRADGIYGLVQWTKEASREIQDGQWRYLSPGFFGLVDGDGFIRPRAIYEVSLTNQPAIADMTQVSAEMEEGWLQFAAEYAADVITKPEPIVTSTETVEAKEHQMDQKEVAVSLGLPETASKEEITARIKDLKASEAVKMELETQEAKRVADAAPKTVTMTAEAFEIEVNARAEKASVAKAENLAKEAKVNALMESGMKSGKIVPAKKDAYLAIAKACPVEFEMLLADIKDEAPVGQTFEGQSKAINLVDCKFDNTDGALNTAAAQLSKSAGITIQEAKASLVAAAK